jgi:hypothetical protein
VYVGCYASRNHVKTLVSTLRDLAKYEPDLAPPIIEPQRATLVTVPLEVSLSTSTEIELKLYHSSMTATRPVPLQTPRCQNLIRGWETGEGEGAETEVVEASPQPWVVGGAGGAVARPRAGAPRVMKKNERGFRPIARPSPKLHNPKLEVTRGVGHRRMERSRREERRSHRAWGGRRATSCTVALMHDRSRRRAALFFQQSLKNRSKTHFIRPH